MPGQEGGGNQSCDVEDELGDLERDARRKVLWEDVEVTRGGRVHDERVVSKLNIVRPPEGVAGPSCLEHSGKGDRPAEMTTACQTDIIQWSKKGTHMCGMELKRICSRCVSADGDGD